jgi:hypothetical protein
MVRFAMPLLMAAMACNTTEPFGKGGSGGVGSGDADSDTDGSDRGGGSNGGGSDTGTVENAAPVVVLETPVDGPIAYAAVPFPWRARVEDAEDPATALALTWQSDLDGVLGELPVQAEADGYADGETALTEGTHVVTVTVVDTEGLSASTSVTLEVGPINSAPVCALTAPADGALVELGVAVDIEASATDVDQSAPSLDVQIESDVDGLLGSGPAASDGSVLASGLALSEGEHIISLLVTDELGATCTDTRTVRIGRAPVVAIASPVDGDVINEGETVALLGTVADPDTAHGDLVASWASDADGAIGTGTVAADASTVLSWVGATAGTHVVTLTGTDPDGLTGSDSISLTINQPPTAPTVRIDPDPAITSDDLVATATGSVDPDGVGTLAYTYAWTRDGASWSGGSVATVPAASTAKHETWVVTVTPTDGHADGPTGSDSITISNADPVLGTPVVSPASGLGVGDTASCGASATDIDGDTVTLTYAWYDAAGTLLGSGSTYTLPETTVSPGSTVVCVVTADDGDGGTATASASVGVVNSNPTVLSVDITPDTGIRAGDVLTCTAVATDPDGDTMTLDYEWRNLTTLVAPSSGPTYTVVGGTDSPGDVIQCTATVTDSRGGSSSDSDTVLVENSDPVVTSVSISPGSPFNDSTVSCAATATDADGGRPSIAFTWSGPSGVIATGAAHYLSSADIMPGEGLTCTAEATDADGGTGSDSHTETIANRLPSLTGVLVSPDPAYVGDTLTCNYATISDADDDPVSVQYEWWNGTTSLATGSSTWVVTEPAGATITCFATPWDGHGLGTTVSDLVHIQNAPPTVDSLSLSPTSPNTVATVTASVTASDPDGDPVYLDYQWLVNGVAVSGATSTSLDGLTNFDKGDTVAVTVSPRGPTTTGIPVTSTAVTVVNTPPLAPILEITPGLPSTSDDLLCEVTTGAYDLDMDSVSYSATWADSTGATASTTSTTIFPGDTLPAALTASEDVWTCTVTPNDGDDDGPTATASVAVDCDMDGDGSVAATCGGDDCDDDDPSRYPGAGDVYGDLEDDDCDGMDCEAASDGSSYYAVCPDEVMTWEDAETACQDQGYDGLVSLETAAEMTYVESLFTTSGTTATAAPWIGLYESGGEGTWIWASGAAVVVTDWASGQPDDDATGGEDCAHLNWPLSGLQWNDAACDGTSSTATVQGLICEKEL